MVFPWFSYNMVFLWFSILPEGILRIFRDGPDPSSSRTRRSSLVVTPAVEPWLAMAHSASWSHGGFRDTPMVNVYHGLRQITIFGTGKSTIYIYINIINYLCVSMVVFASSAKWPEIIPINIPIVVGKISISITIKTPSEMRKPGDDMKHYGARGANTAEQQML